MQRVAESEIEISKAMSAGAGRRPAAWLLGASTGGGAPAWHRASKQQMRSSRSESANGLMPAHSCRCLPAARSLLPAAPCWQAATRHQQSQGQGRGAAPQPWAVRPMAAVEMESLVPPVSTRDAQADRSLSIAMMTPSQVKDQLLSQHGRYHMDSAHESTAKNELEHANRVAKSVYEGLKQEEYPGTLKLLPLQRFRLAGRAIQQLAGVLVSAEVSQRRRGYSRCSEGESVAGEPACVGAPVYGVGQHPGVPGALCWRVAGSARAAQVHRERVVRRDAARAEGW
jgi:hypothetical protein